MPEFVNTVVQMNAISGVTECAVVDIETGRCLAHSGIVISSSLQAAALVSARMLRSKLQMAHDHYDDGIEDILVTMVGHYHLIRLVHLDNEMPRLFLYLVLNRSTANLAIARRQLGEVAAVLMDLPNAPDRIEADRLRALNRGIDDARMSHQEDLPPFMRDSVVMKLLGISAPDDEACADFQRAGSESI